MASVAALLGVRDFLEAIPELSARRQWLQSARRRSDAELLERFGDHWRSGVPSAHSDLHLALRSEVLTVLGLD